jgi:hypothetical protein
MRSTYSGRSHVIAGQSPHMTEVRQGRRLRGGAIKVISDRIRSLRLAAQDVALSRRKQGFESPRERHPDKSAC